MRTSEWIHTSRNRIFLDMHFPDWDAKGICSKFDTDDMAETFQQSYVDSVILYAKCQYGNFYYNTKLGHKHSGLGDKDLFNELTQKAHEKGIKVIAYYSVNWDEYMANLHPEWLVEGPDGTKDNLEEYRWSTLCINSPYREQVFRHLREIAQETATDGFWLDMTIIGKNRCFCSYCRQKFRDQYGTEFPANDQDENWNLYLQWRYDYIEEFYAEAVTLIKGIDENILVVNNYWGYPYQSGSMGSRAVGALKAGDFATGEAYTDWTGLNAPGIFSKYLRGAGGNKPFEVLIGRFYNTWDYTLKSKIQMAYEAYTVIANGGTVTLDDEPYHDGAIEKEVYANLKEIFEVVNSRAEALDGATPVKHVGIFHSQATKDYMHNYGDVTFIPPIAGAYKVFRDLHHPVGFLFDEDFSSDTLKDYKVLVLPDVGCMSSRQQEVIRNFVKEGGVLISTGKTSLLNEVGVWENNFGLSDVFGLDYQGHSDHSPVYFELNGRLMGEKFNTNRPYALNTGYVQCCSHHSSICFAHIMEPICETKEKTFFHNNLPAPYQNTGFPAITVNRYGKGSSLYFAAEVFSCFAKKGQREVKELISFFLSEFSCDPGVKVECPSSVEMVVNMINKDKMAIHLINPHMDLPVCYGHMEVFNGYYDRTLECIEDVVPIFNTKASIEIPGGTHIKSLRLFEGKPITDYVIHGGRCSFVIPEIQLWQTVLVDFEAEAIRRQFENKIL